MRRPNQDMKIFKNRRAKLAKEVEGSAVLLFSSQEQYRNHDVTFPFRQDSNFFYLTGFDEPDSIFLFRPGMNPETVMFVRKKDLERETWDGFRYGPEGAKVEFGIDQCFILEDFEAKIPDLLKGIDRLYTRLYKSDWSDRLIRLALQKTKSSQGRSGAGLRPIFDSDILIGEQRIFKSEYDLEQQRKACLISAQAHTAAMRSTKPGVSERQIQAILTQQFLHLGCAREGYSYIVAAGANATTLHYNFNDQTCSEGDLLLIDAGAEYNYFTGDITRTFPVNGKFSEAQSEVYQGVLLVQKELLAMIKPGLKFNELQEKAIDRLVDVMLDLGIVMGRKSDIIASQSFKKYYPHSVSHWLGMDVHDAGLYIDKENMPRALEPNMCFTIEPGIYIPVNDESAPKKYRGIGVRIEDNILVTLNGMENMTVACPKEVTDIENTVGSSF